MKFKKILSGILACATVCSAVPYVSYNFSGNISITANATAYTTGTYENLTYKAYTNYIEISKCDSSATSAVIPAEINGLPVTSIGAGAFDGCKSLTEITIPDSVTYIGLEAFSGCSSLTEITIPDSVTNIAERAFFSCSVLTEIKLSKNITNVDSNTFAFCESLKSITIPDGVTNIGANAFSKCYNLTEITIPESVASIGEDTFYGCEK
ncbi:MAG: leucine-rich repeat domain-containing protein, partial [Ruminococcus sp.]|nr:leucine-rich repeat domain-containing protein [Ruminococcus sp.]